VQQDEAMPLASPSHSNSNSHHRSSLSLFMAPDLSYCDLRPINANKPIEQNIAIKHLFIHFRSYIIFCLILDLF